MAKKLVKKRKLRVFRLLLVLLILALFSLGIYLFINDTTKNIIIENTEYLNDDYIIELAEIKDYPSFWLTSSKKIEKKLEKSPYIKKVKIKRRFYNVLKIEVIENRPLFMYEGDQNIVFESTSSVRRS